MGVLKDAVHLAVVEHLRTQRNNQTLTLSLNAPNGIGPASIRTAWSNLKENGKDEGMKKSIGIQAVLKERLDLFYFNTNDKGHNLITLTPSTLEWTESTLPPRGPGYIPPPQLAVIAEAGGGTGLVAASSSETGPKAKKQKITGSYTGGPLKGTGKAKGGYYQDIVWTPEMMVHNEAVKAKCAKMARALYNACEVHGGKRVTISQLGANYDVAQLKKDSQFHTHKLIDILKFHEGVFELVTDSGIGGFVVNLQPGGGAALPDAETFFNEMTEADLFLPERVEAPYTQQQKMQALRVELVHVLHKRGGKAQLNELGQDQTVQKVKTGLPKALKLIEFIRSFPMNYTVTPRPDGLMDVTLDSPDCYDQSMIERSIEKTRAATERFREKGMGKGSSSSFPRTSSQPSFGGSLGAAYDAQQAALAQSPQQQYLNALAAQQTLAAAYGALGHTAIAPGFPQGFSSAPPAAAPRGLGFSI